MTNKAIANLTNIHVLTPALLNVMYRQFSGDSASTVPETKLAIIQQALIQGVDMIEMNDLMVNLPSHREDKFNDYWDAVSRVLDQDMTIPDERRTGDAFCISRPACPSLQHLHKEETEELQRTDIFPLPDIPSEEHLRRQFTPTNW